MNQELIQQFGSGIPQELSQGMVKSYIRARAEYQAEKYDAVVSETGKFVEYAVRALEHIAKGEYTPLNKSLPALSAQHLESITGSISDEPGHTLLPKTLYTMYGFRNKCSSAHIASLKPHWLDAVKLLQDMEWAISAFIVLGSQYDKQKIAELLSKLNTRPSALIWDVDGVTRVLLELNTAESVLLLLSIKGPMTKQELLSATEYKNASRFSQAILEPLHKQRLINYNKGTNKCTISPIGVQEISKTLEKMKGDWDVYQV